MNTNRWIVTTAPTWEPVTLAEAKDHMRVDHSDEDAVISGLIPSAREYLEGVLGSALPQQSITAYYSTFWNLLTLPRACPLQSVTSVKYLDEDGVLQTVDSAVYDVYTAPTPGEVRLAYNQTWPTHRIVTDPVRIEYVAGYAGAGSVPAPLRAAMLLLIGHWYENREATSPLDIKDVPGTIGALVTAYKMRWV